MVIQIGVDILYEEETSQTTALKSLILALVILDIPIHAIGVFGAFNEHYKLSMTYGIIVSISLLLTIFYSLMAETLIIVNMVLNLLVAVMAITFAIKIKRAKQANSNA
jgi:hypothetical protein